VKSNLVRLIDVFAIGPMMIYSATEQNKSPAMRAGLVIIGLFTIIYNAQNFIIRAKRQR
jgi:hypothetical protein